MVLWDDPQHEDAGAGSLSEQGSGCDQHGFRAAVEPKPPRTAEFRAAPGGSCIPAALCYLYMSSHHLVN